MKRRLTSTLFGLVALSAAIALGLVACEAQKVAYQNGTEAPSTARAPTSGGLAEGTGRAPAGPSGSRPSLEEEVWVIARPESPSKEETEREAPRGSRLLTKDPEKKKKVALPLDRTDVDASIHGSVASVRVRQAFRNPYDTKIEAVYVFPLPQDAAVNEFLMIIGDRKIRGIIREREEAERIYKQARKRGHAASLLTQERPNVFTQKVANIEPGKKIDVDIRYFNTLPYKDGWHTFTFPAVVGPRFNPSGHDEGIGTVGRGGRGQSGQPTEVPYLAPDERSGHTLDLAVDIDAGVPIEEIRSPTHAIEKDSPSPEKASVRLASDGTTPNKDFMLRYRVAGDRLRSGLVVDRGQKDEPGYFALTLYPPKELRSLDRRPVEMIFVVDCSGSMSGRPIRQAKDAVTSALGMLEKRDTFQVIRFSNEASRFGDSPLRATDANVERVRSYVEDLEASGGTMMIEGIEAALDLSHDRERLRFVTFLTDGYIGNEAEILGAIHEKLGASRIFSFGIGSSPNRYLLNRMAKVGRGAVAYLSSEEEAGPVMENFFRRVSHPALADIHIDWGGLEVSGVYPRPTPDLFVGRSVTLTGRFNGEPEGTIRVTGRTGENKVSFDVPVEPDRSEVEGSALSSVWARQRIASLADRSVYQQEAELTQRIKRVALRHNLMSAYTAFVAVDASRRTGGDHGVSVRQPVPVPEGVRYETTVPE